MRVTIDGQQCEDLPATSRTILDVLTALEAEMIAEGRCVQQIYLDGTQVLDRSSLEPVLIEHARNFEVRTTPIQGALQDAAQSALDYLPRLEQGLAQAAEFLQEGDLQKGLEWLKQAVSGLQWYVDFLTAAIKLGSRRSPEAAADRLEHLRRPLVGVTATWEEGDYSLLADLLLYEIVPELARGREWLLDEFQLMEAPD